MLETDKNSITFKLVVTPELAETLNSQQWSKIGELIDRSDEVMEKEEARRLILESEFSMTLNEEQRNTFIKLNKIN